MTDATAVAALDAATGVSFGAVTDATATAALWIVLGAATGVSFGAPMRAAMDTAKRGTTGATADNAEGTLGTAKTPCVMMGTHKFGASTPLSEGLTGIMHAGAVACRAGPGRSLPS